MKKIIIIMLILFSVEVAIANCTISTPNLSHEQSAIMPITTNLSPYTISYSCSSGLAYTISYVSPSQTTAGMITVRKTGDTTKNIQLYLYRLSNYSDAIRPANKTVKVGTATGEQETAIIYPQIRNGAGCNWNGTISKYLCFPGIYSETISLKITF